MALDADRVEKSIRRVDRFLKKAPKNPTPEQIHDVRTSTRRLEAALDTLKIGKRGLKKRLERELRRIRKRCGKLRDMDVLTGHAISVTPEDSERDCLVQLVEYLGASRHRYAQKLRKAAKQIRRELRDDLARLVKEVDKLSDQNRRDGRLPGTDGQNASALLKLRAELQSPPQLDKNNLHPYRLKVKELRYALQLSEGTKDDSFVNTLGNVKDAIGEWHDWEELVAIASKVIGHGPQCKLLRQLKRISAEKFEQALEITNRMRSAYVDGRRRGKARKKQPTPLPLRIVQAARA
jgi:CHAD domain-containing protein